MNKSFLLIIYWSHKIERNLKMLSTETNISLYDYLGMKAGKSIYKSVYVTNDLTCEGYQIVEVEAWDNHFLKQIATPSKYEITLNRIMKKVYNTFDNDIWLKVYTEFGHREYLLSKFYMKEVFKLI